MCGRFALTTTPKDVEEMFDTLDVEDFPPRFNIAPTQPVLMIAAGPRREAGSNLPSRRSQLVRWGFIPSWAKDPRSFPLLINARSETAAEKATFRAAIRHRRTLVPATGFYEWRREGKRKPQAYWVRPKKGGVIAFAGLMENWLEPGGSEMDTGAILTTSANSDIRHIHERMPVVIHRRDFDRWLDCVGKEPRDVADLMRPVEPGFFEAIPVSDKVNKVANTGPDLQERVELDASEALEDKPKETADRQLALF